MPHVLTLALGPVQEFLVAARRTRDLWFGSWLLSELARAAGSEIERHSGAGSLIFPAAPRLRVAEATFTNKILALIEGEPSDVAARVIAAVHQRLAELREEAFRGFPDAPDFQAEVAQAQVGDLIEIEWASASLATPADYAAARGRAEALLAARKNCRLWGAVSWGASVPKSSIDGQRESVIHEDLFDAGSGWSATRLYRTFGIGERERLCGVGLLKRRGRRTGSRFAHHFLSTGHLAAWPLLERMRRMAEGGDGAPRLRRAWAAFERKILALGADLGDWRVFAQGQGHPILGELDGSLLFTGRLSDLFPDIRDKCEQRRRAQPIAQALALLLEEAGVSTPCPYFAVLVADGDRMSRAIERLDAVERHRELSRTLTDFAVAAGHIVEREHRGELVFAGGDDVLAFVPLDRAVSCARALASEFDERLKSFPAGTGGISPTLSVGLGIAHFMEPLSRALDLARDAEKDAKRTRATLAIRLDKRSGPALAVAGPWGELDQELADLVALHVEDRVPDGAAFELRELARLESGEGGDKLAPLVRKEAERILRRKQPRHGQENALAPETLERLEAIYERTRTRVVIGGLAAFADRLVLARLLAEATVQAAVPEPPATNLEAA